MDEAALIEELAREAFRSTFHPDETDETIAQCWANWPESQRKHLRLAKAILPIIRRIHNDAIESAAAEAEAWFPGDSARTHPKSAVATAIRTLRITDHA